MSHIARSSHGPSGAQAFAGAELQPHDDCGNLCFHTIICKGHVGAMNLVVGAVVGAVGAVVIYKEVIEN